MRAPNGWLGLVVAGACSVGGGCTGGPVDPSPVRMADAAALVLAGFPAGQTIRTGESVLLSIPDVPDQVESIRWDSSDPAVASVTATPAVSPCGTACAWVRGESAGRSLVGAQVCFVDGSCASVNRAHVCQSDGTRCVVSSVLSVLP